MGRALEAWQEAYVRARGEEYVVRGERYAKLQGVGAPGDNRNWMGRIDGNFSRAGVVDSVFAGAELAGSGRHQGFQAVLDNRGHDGVEAMDNYEGLVAVADA